MRVCSRLLACWLVVSAVMFVGCGSSKEIFFENFENGQLDQPPPNVPDKGVEITVDQAGLAKVVTFPPHLDTKSMGYMQPKGSFPQSVYFKASPTPSGYDNGYRVLWTGYYVSPIDGGAAVSLSSGHFNSAFTLIFKGGNIKVMQNNQETTIGTYSNGAGRKHSVIASVNRVSGKYSLWVGNGDGSNVTKDGTIENPAFWNSNDVYLRVWAINNRPDNAMNQDMYVIDNPSITATKKPD